jgi:WD40 repeat protein
MADAVAVTPDKSIIIAGAGSIADRPGYIKLWDFATGTFIRSDPWDHYIFASIVATLDSRSIVVSGREDHTFSDGMFYILVGDIETGKYRAIRTGHDFSLGLSFTWDKKYIKFDQWQTGLSWDWQIGNEFIWDWQIGGEPRLRSGQRNLLHQNTRQGIELTTKHILSSTDETFIIEDIQARRVVQEFSTGHDNPYHRYTPIKVTPNGRYLLSQKGHDQACLAMWDISTGKFVKTFESCKGTIKSIDITADGQYIVVLGYDPDSVVIRVLDFQTEELMLSIDPEQ